jgi:hypothetical protein
VTSVVVETRPTNVPDAKQLFIAAELANRYIGLRNIDYNAPFVPVLQILVATNPENTWMVET